MISRHRSQSRTRSRRVDEIGKLRRTDPNDDDEGDERVVPGREDPRDDYDYHYDDARDAEEDVASRDDRDGSYRRRETATADVYDDDAKDASPATESPSSAAVGGGGGPSSSASRAELPRAAAASIAAVPFEDAASSVAGGGGFDVDDDDDGPWTASWPRSDTDRGEREECGEGTIRAEDCEERSAPDEEDYATAEEEELDGASERSGLWDPGPDEPIFFDVEDEDGDEDEDEDDEQVSSTKVSAEGNAQNEPRNCDLRPPSACDRSGAPAIPPVDGDDNKDAAWHRHGETSFSPGSAMRSVHIVAFGAIAREGRGVADDRGTSSGKLGRKEGNYSSHRAAGVDERDLTCQAASEEEEKDRGMRRPQREPVPKVGTATALVVGGDSTRREEVECLLECYTGIVGGGPPASRGGAPGVGAVAMGDVEDCNDDGPDDPKDVDNDIGADGQNGESAEEEESGGAEEETESCGSMRTTEFVEKNTKKESETTVLTERGTARRSSVFKLLFSKKKTHVAKNLKLKRIRTKKRKKRRRASASSRDGVPSIVGSSAVVSVASSVTGIPSTLAPPPSAGHVIATRISGLARLARPFIARGADSVRESLASVGPMIERSADSIQESLAYVEPLVKKGAESIQGSLVSVRGDKPSSTSRPSEPRTFEAFDASMNSRGGRSTAKGFEVVMDEGRGEHKIMVSRPGNRATMKRKGNNATYGSRNGIRPNASVRTGDDIKVGLIESGDKAWEDHDAVPEETVDVVRPQIGSGTGQPGKKIPEDRSLVLKNEASGPGSAARSSRKGVLAEWQRVRRNGNRNRSHARGSALGRRRWPKPVNIVRGSDEGSGAVETPKGRGAKSAATKTVKNAKNRNRARSYSLGRRRAGGSGPKEERGGDDETGGFWEDDGVRSGRSGKKLLEDGKLVPKEAFEPKSVARTIKNMNRSPSPNRGRVRSFSAGRKKQRAKSGAEGTNGIVENARGKLVPKEAFEPKSVPRTIKNMNRSPSPNRGRVRSFLVSRRKQRAKSGAEGTNGIVEKARGGSRCRSQTPFRRRKKGEDARSRSLVRNKTPVRTSTAGLVEDEAEEVVADPTTKERRGRTERRGASDANRDVKKRGGSRRSRFGSPVLFRGRGRKARSKSEPPAVKADLSNANSCYVESSMESSRAVPKSLLPPQNREDSEDKNGSDCSFARSTKSKQSKGCGEWKASFETKPGFERDFALKRRLDGSIMGRAQSGKSKTNCVSWSSPISVVKSKSNVGFESKRSFRGWRHDDPSDGEDDEDVSFVERELFSFSERLVSEGIDWFNRNHRLKLFDVSAADAKNDSDDIEATGAWENAPGTRLNWNGDASRDGIDHEEMTEERLLERTKDWFNWNAAATSWDSNGSMTDDEGEASNLSFEEDDTSRETSVEGIEATVLTAEQGGDGWFAPLANYLADPHLGDIGLTEAEEEDDERNDSRSARRSKFRRGAESGTSLRPKGGSRCKGSNRGHHSPTKLGRRRSPSRTSAGRDSPVMDNVLLLL